MIRTLLGAFVVLALSLGSCLMAQDDPAHIDATKEFLKYWKKSKEESMQVEAIKTLKGNECRLAAEELLKLLKHPNGVVQQTALDILGTYNSLSTYQTWIDELPKMKDAEMQAILIKVLGRAKLPEALPVIEALANEPKASQTIKYEAMRALPLIGKAGTLGLVPKLLGDGDALVRMAAADAVGKLKVQGCGPALVGLLDDAEWQVQTAAVTALSIVRPQDSVQPLIDLMRKTGRLRTECADALFRITGFDFGVDPDKWQEQWKNLMAIPGWRIPTDEELAKKAETRRKNDEYYGKKTKPTSFVNIPTTSTNVLFIIDVSGSMDDLVVEVEKFASYKDRKKFTIVQTELLNTIDNLDDTTNFNIVAFASDLNVWKPRLVPGNIVNRDAAKSFVRGLKPLGGTESQELASAGLGGSANLAAGKTNTLKALLYSFGVDPDKPPKAAVTGADKGAMKSPLDTVYFLSDGRPSVGKFVDPNEIRKEVRRHNEAYRMVIHTIAIGEFQKEFLEQLAVENGGVFVDMGR
jgi:hypothetical protein